MDKSVEEGSKKSPFEEMSKEELVKKCKGLLVIAQKAKQTKAELSSEITSLKEQYEKLEMQKGADKECLKTMQEFVDTMTEQKLSLASEIDGLKKQNSQLKNSIQLKENEIKGLISSRDEQINNLRAEIQAGLGHLSQLDTELTVLKRQKGRLEKENEELMVQMTEFEDNVKRVTEESLEQKKRIEELEKISEAERPNQEEGLINGTNEAAAMTSDVQNIVHDRNKTCEEFETLKLTLESKCKSLSDLEVEFDSIKMQLDDKINALVQAENGVMERDETIKENLKNYEAEKVKKEKLNAKLKQYRDKIVKCSSSITQLKNSKFVLLKTVSEYSESVPKWQQDIFNASKLLSEQLLAIEDENKILKEKVFELEKSKDVTDSKMEYDDSNSELLNDYKELCSKLDALKLENENALLNIQSLESEKLILINEKKSAREIIHKNDIERNELMNANQELISKVAQFNAEISTLKEQCDLLASEKSDMLKNLEEAKENNAKSDNSIIKGHKEKVAALKLSLVSVEEENNLLIEANETLKAKVEELTSSVDQIDPEGMEHNIMLQADISKLETKMAAYKTENASLLFEIKESRQRLMELDSVLKELEDAKGKLVNYKSENMELLNEMKEINQVFKERGETISKQDMEITETNRKLKNFEEELKKIGDEKEAKIMEIKTIKEKLREKDSRLKLVNMHKDSYDESADGLKLERDNLKSLLAERDAIIISLNEDINKIRKNRENLCYDAPSENMSISTTSKVEESSRLRDLDESFEERYAKLRMLAIKLKKRVGELTIQLKTLEDEKAGWEADKTKLTPSKWDTTGTVSKNMQSMQNEYDKMMDKLERKDVEMKNKDKLCQEMKLEVDKLSQDVMDARERHAKVEKDFEFLEKEKSAIDMALKECHGQIAAMKKECDSLKEKEAELLHLKGDLATKEEKYLSEVSGHQATREALERAKRDVKKKSVLSLEMEDYERSMKDLTTKMEDNKKKIVQMESTIDTQEGTIHSLRTQIKMLEDQMASEERINRETKELLYIATENLKEKEVVINAKLEYISKLEKKLEEANLNGEDISIQLASALGEKEKVALCLGQEKLELNTRLKKCEHRCSELEEKIKLKVIELDEIKTEFASYKVRAHNVLRQNQTKDVSIEENLKEEMTALKAELEVLRPELQSTKEELESVMSDRARLVSRCSELQSTLHTERELANTQIQRDLQEYNTLKLQMSTLTQCYKKQIADLEERTSEEIGNLRKEIEYYRVGLERANALTKDQAHALEKKPPLQFSNLAVSAADSANSNNEHGISDANDNIGEINVAMLEREEGEGSESTPSPSPTYMSRSGPNLKRSGFQSINRGTSGNENRRREPVPLEQLLEGDIPEENYIEGDLETRLEAALRQIETQEKRLAHMTEVIAEAEKEVARRTQLGEALKEEVRRCERQLERTMHHHNQEYLKNVIIKFLTLSAGDERSRLVPVLHTILTLSPEETHQLTAVAKGVDPTSPRGWGSYLPWPGKG